MRLIDSNALHKTISKWEENVMYKDWVQSAIANSPTIESEPVVHGYWIINGIPLSRVIGNFKCSVCGGISLKDSKYCPNCGAKMDEEG